jgi:hypothetical protein
MGGEHARASGPHRNGAAVHGHSSQAVVSTIVERAGDVFGAEDERTSKVAAAFTLGRTWDERLMQHSVLTSRTSVPESPVFESDPGYGGIRLAGLVRRADPCNLDRRR